MSLTSNNTSNPYSSISDLLSNVRNFKIIESTLREGEQFANAFFTRETKIKINLTSSEFGVDYIELTNPCASPSSRADCEAICKLGLKDAKVACDCGVDGVDVVIGTSQFLREHSLGGKDMTAITKQAIEVIEYIKSRGCEVRFSSEDSFRTLRGVVSTDIEVHINVPFNNPITGFCAFTHKAGIHAKAILNNPSTVHFTSRLVGWNAIKSRVDQLGLKMTDAQVKECTAKLKSMADLKVMTLDDSDALIRSFHLELQNGA
ncbi:putative homocitrate synthase protein [Phaeoacremonium minimum UCRPA7]|uniref:Putative homocitrate synthase protein n=1 Tax=Phaeoacremonium minimum (strain UCR-PA7) TaxID=1286976 RepID=R8BR71_PHAM7|nr:putative homocitrate synthase protein [Phaeoacremonium minimum UCRPA7]EOO01847.1 putative homocitrate synthase protein [Phaeoacremonium minimum UCRPA7]